MTLEITRRNGRIERDPTPRWQRSKNALILRRFGRQTLGIVVPNGDADGTYSWLSRAHDQGNQPARYSSEDEAVAALLAVLGLAA